MSTAALDYPLSENAPAQIDVEKHIDRWRDQEGNLIMILHDIQDEHG